MKTSELTGALLNYYVGKADKVWLHYRLDVFDLLSKNMPFCDVAIIAGYEGQPRCALVPTKLFQHRHATYDPLVNWEITGRIIEKEKIQINLFGQGEGSWRASNYNSDTDTTTSVGNGSTPIEAVLRCFVRSKFGDEVPTIAFPGLENPEDQESWKTTP